MNLLPTEAIAVILCAANVAAFLAFLLDKRRSEADLWRIPERTLLSLAFWGGSLGALAGQQILRHKTRKEPFRSHLMVIAFFHIVLAVILLEPALQNLLLQIVKQIILYAGSR